MPPSSGSESVLVSRDFKLHAHAPGCKGITRIVMLPSKGLMFTSQWVAEMDLGVIQTLAAVCMR